jgi:hypothetical protein
MFEAVCLNSDELPYPLLGDRRRRVIPAQVGENLPEELVVCSTNAPVTVAQTVTKHLSHRSSSPFCTLGAAYPRYFLLSLLL